MEPADAAPNVPRRAVQPTARPTSDTKKIFPPADPVPNTMAPKSFNLSQDWTEVTMVANTFKVLHALAFPLVQYLLQLSKNSEHPFKVIWQSYLDKEKGLTAESSFHAVKSLMGLKNIDDYRRILLQCPGITEYLTIQRSDPKYNSKLKYKLIKTFTAATEIIAPITNPATSSTPTIHSITATANVRKENDPEPQRLEPKGQPKYPDILSSDYVKISISHDDKSFEKFFYQAYPLITSWCVAPENNSTTLSKRWKYATERGLSPLSNWELVFELLEIHDLEEFCDIVRHADQIQETFDLIWRTPHLYYLPLYDREYPTPDISPSIMAKTTKIDEVFRRRTRETTRTHC